MEAFLFMLAMQSPYRVVFLKLTRRLWVPTPAPGLVAGELPGAASAVQQYRHDFDFQRGGFVMSEDLHGSDPKTIRVTTKMGFKGGTRVASDAPVLPLEDFLAGLPIQTKPRRPLSQTDLDRVTMTWGHPRAANLMVLDSSQVSESGG